MKEEKYISLLHRRLLGKIEAEDAQALKHWTQQAPENELMANRIAEVWDKSATYTPAFEPNVEQGLKRFKRRIQAEEAPAKVVAMPRRRIGWLAAASVAAIILGVWGFSTLFNSPSPQLTAYSEIAPRALNLSDGTEVQLNQHSRIDYLAEWTSGKRIVQLSGEAFFEVAKNPEQPFVVETPHAQVEVLGTAFNLRAYEDEPLIELTVDHGKVRFSPSNSDQSWILEKGDQVYYNWQRKTIQERRDEGGNANAWMDQLLQFNDLPIGEVAQYLERVYQIDIQVAAAIRSCRVTADFTNSSVAEVMEVLETIVGLEYTIANNTDYKWNKGSCDFE